MNHGLVSVVIPVYNSELYIKECINSVLSQTYENYEIIVVDDGSTDKSADIISEFQSNKIKLFRQKNSGVAAARNYAARVAQGMWLAFIDSDDIWYPDKLSRQLDKCHHLNWSHTDSYFIGNVYPEHTRSTDFTAKFEGSILSDLVVENFIGTSSVVIKKEIFYEFDGFSPELKALEDWDLWLRVASKYDICYLDEVLDGYRTQSNSISRSARNTLPYHVDQIKRIFKKGGVAESLIDLKNVALSKSYIINSYISEQESDFMFSLHCTYQALLIQPFRFSLYTRIFKLLVKMLLFYLNIPFNKAGQHN